MADQEKPASTTGERLLSSGAPPQEGAGRGRWTFRWIFFVAQYGLMALSVGCMAAYLVFVLYLKHLSKDVHPHGTYEGAGALLSVPGAVAIVVTLCVVYLVIDGLVKGRTYGWLVTAMLTVSAAILVVSQKYADGHTPLLELCCVLFAASWLVLRARTYRPFRSHHTL